MSDHRAEAERLLRNAARLRAWSSDPNAAGSAIRARWAKEADVLMAQAQVHATLAAVDK